MPSKVRRAEAVVTSYLCYNSLDLDPASLRFKIYSPPVIGFECVVGITIFGQTILELFSSWSRFAIKMRFPEIWFPQMMKTTVSHLIHQLFSVHSLFTHCQVRDGSSEQEFCEQTGQSAFNTTIIT